MAKRTDRIVLHESDIALSKEQNGLNANEVKVMTTKRLRSEAMNFKFVYTGIRVKNMDESIKFYTEVLGMEIAEKRERTEPTKGEGVTLKSPDSNQLLELNFYESDSPFYAPYENGEDLDHLAFDVENLEGAISDLRKKGIEIVVEPYQIGANVGWKEAFIKDPNGIWIEFLQRK